MGWGTPAKKMERGGGTPYIVGKYSVEYPTILSQTLFYSGELQPRLSPRPAPVLSPWIPAEASRCAPAWLCLPSDLTCWSPTLDIQSVFFFGGGYKARCYHDTLTGIYIICIVSVGQKTFFICNICGIFTEQSRAEPCVQEYTQRRQTVVTNDCWYNLFRALFGHVQNYVFLTLVNSSRARRRPYIQLVSCPRPTDSLRSYEDSLFRSYLSTELEIFSECTMAIISILRH